MYHLTGESENETLMGSLKLLHIHVGANRRPNKSNGHYNYCSFSVYV